jgi:hypothetical protein
MITYIAFHRRSRRGAVSCIKLNASSSPPGAGNERANDLLPLLSSTCGHHPCTHTRTQAHAPKSGREISRRRCREAAQ